MLGNYITTRSYRLADNCYAPAELQWRSNRVDTERTNEHDRTKNLQRFRFSLAFFAEPLLPVASRSLASNYETSKATRGR